MKLSISPPALLSDHARVTVNLQAVAAGVGLLLLFGALWAFLLFASPNLAGNDDYFHIKFAQVMREQGLRPNFIWLPLTILNANSYADHHFLYHVLLIPFATSNLIIGAKWSVIVFSSLAFWMGWLLLRGQNVPYAALWALGFFALSDAFLYRLSMTRVQGVSLLLLLLALHLLLTRRHGWLLPLAFAYTWLYDAFPLFLGVVTIYVAIMALFERRLLWRPLVLSLLGVGLGLLINPYFPFNVIFVYHHYLPKIVDIGAADIEVGNEWYAYSTWALVKNSGPTLVVLLAGSLALGLHNRRMEPATAVLFFVTLFFGALLFKSRRFIEYFPAFALLFCAAAWKPLLANWQRRSFAAPLALANLVLAGMLLTLPQARATLIDTTSAQRYEQASAWLQANSAPGSRVFQSDWDDFAQLFFYNTHNTYTLGLDPTYMHLFDPELYHLWRDTTRGWGNIGPVIKEKFAASFALTDLSQQGFIDKADRDPWLKRVYEDEYAIIYQVLDQPDPGKKSWYD